MSCMRRFSRTSFAIVYSSLGRSASPYGSAAQKIPVLQGSEARFWRKNTRLNTLRHRRGDNTTINAREQRRLLLPQRLPVSRTPCTAVFGDPCRCTLHQRARQRLRGDASLHSSRPAHVPGPLASPRPSSPATLLWSRRLSRASQAIGLHGIGTMIRLFIV